MLTNPFCASIKPKPWKGGFLVHYTTIAIVSYYVDMHSVEGYGTYQGSPPGPSLLADWSNFEGDVSYLTIEGQNPRGR